MGFYQGVIQVTFYLSFMLILIPSPQQWIYNDVFSVMQSAHFVGVPNYATYYSLGLWELCSKFLLLFYAKSIFP